MAIAMDEKLSTVRTNDVLFELASLHAQNISCATTRECLLRYINCGDVPGLCNYTVNYVSVSVSDALEIRQILAFFQKREDVSLVENKETAAWLTFVATEKSCSLINKQFRALALGKDFLPSRVHSILHRASRKISRVLGPVPCFSELRPRFGPGATTSVNKKNASHKRKLSEGCQCNEGLVALLPEILEEVPAWCELLNTAPPDRETYNVPVQVVNAQLSFVPKNAKTFRSIVVEPSLNGFVQNGIGDFIAGRLLRYSGIDISDQSANQSAARQGSLLGDLATLDLSNASDTIATELVYHLLPYDWAILLDRCRSQYVEYHGEVMKLQKFSSMGNGFTFPLETLIFWALASAASEDDPRVLAYGDDLVVPSEYADACIEVLSLVGFTVNKEKSYVSGPFRESCGKDYLSGINIRPVYIKDRVDNFDLFRLHNFYVRSYRKDLSDAVLSLIPECLRIWGPDGYGDGHLVGDHPVNRHNFHRGWGGYLFETYTKKSRHDTKCRIGDVLLPAYSVYVRGEGPSRDSAFTSHTSDGIPSGSLPGEKGYKRIKIYTLG